MWPQEQGLSTHKNSSESGTAGLPISVDVVIPVYGERPQALAATLAACLGQKYPVSQIFIVDDGSPEAVRTPESLARRRDIHLIRLERNQGISAARNTAILQSSAPFVACINVDVLPEPDWLTTCLAYMHARARLGACFSRIVPADPKRMLSRWRMRFHEQRYGDESGPAPFAPGHAVLFRKEAIDAVGGYDARRRRITEDFDICERIRDQGYEIHYVAESRCISIQEDRLVNLCRKQLLRADWSSPMDYSLGRVVLGESKWFAIRVARNLATCRLAFIPIDVAIWVGTLCLAGKAFAGEQLLRRSKNGVPI